MTPRKNPILASQFAFLDAAPDAMLLVDDTGRIANANVEASRLLGFAVSELIGNPVEMLIPDRFRGEIGRASCRERV